MNTLTPEQQDWYERHFGLRYVAVQENNLRPSRRMRRAARFGGRRDITDRDVAVYEAQQDAIRELQKTQIVHAEKAE